MKCPNCGLTNPDNAMWCDCGYDFKNSQLESSHTSDGYRRKEILIKRRGQVTYLILVLLSFALGFVGSYLSGFRDFADTNAIAYSLGQGAGLLAITAILVGIYAGVKRLITHKQNESLAGSVWVTWVIVAVLSYLGQYSGYKEEREETKDGRALLDNIADALEKGLETGIMGDIEVPEEKTEAQVMAEFMSRFVHPIQKLDEALQTTTEMPAIFDAAFLGAKQFNQARQNIRELEALYEKNREDRLAQLTYMRKEVHTIDLPEGTKARFERGFEKSYQDSRDIINQYFDVQKRFFELGLEYLDFMENTSYQIKEGEVLFEAQEELDAYNDYQAVLERISSTEETIVEGYVEMQENRIKRLRREAR